MISFFLIFTGRKNLKVLRDVEAAHDFAPERDDVIDVVPYAGLGREALGLSVNRDYRSHIHPRRSGVLRVEPDPVSHAVPGMLSHPFAVVLRAVAGAPSRTQFHKTWAHSVVFGLATRYAFAVADVALSIVAVPARLAGVIP